MISRQIFSRGLGLLAAFGLCAGTARASAPPVAVLSSAPGALSWQVAAPHERAVLTVSGPDGRSWRLEFPAGGALRFPIVDAGGAALPDGSYVYEIRLTPKLTSAALDRLKAARTAGTEAATIDALRREGQLPAPENLISQGSFMMTAGHAVTAGAVEPPSSAAPRPAPAPRSAAAAPTPPGAAAPGGGRVPYDQVIADDLDVQGSACVGLDCVNNESFGFDTIRLKANNTRITFVDTSASAGFATRDWRLRANDSASGGLNAFYIDDMGDASTGADGATFSPFTIVSPAPTNSIFVANNGKVGFRTATPVLDIHVATGDTPAHRFEQTGASGYTPQTWDVAGNEANFFVRDVTAGSLLPFRIRPGAPTSSIDISASGNVGIGTASPANKISVSNGAYLSNGGVWTNASSREYKKDITPLGAGAAQAAFRALNPVTYEYKASPGETHVGFIAEDVPALVATPDRKGLSAMDVVALLTKVAQSQQERIDALEKRLGAMEQACPAKR